jgi:hypothetical protein
LRPRKTAAPTSASCCREPRNMKTDILLIEDDPGTSSALKKVLQD